VTFKITYPLQVFSNIISYSFAAFDNISTDMVQAMRPKSTFFSVSREI